MGLQFMIQQSQEYADQLVETFYRYHRAGLDINSAKVQNCVWAEVGCCRDDLMDYDYKRMIREVESLCR